MRYRRLGGVLFGLAVAGCGGSAAAPPAGSPTAATTGRAKHADPATGPTDLRDGSTTKVKPTRRVSRPAAQPAATTVAAAAAGPRLAHPIPASFGESAVSPGAPSDDQVRAELQQMYAAQAHERKLSAEAANFAGLLPWVAERKTGERVSVASVFRDYGLGLACGGVLAVTQIGVAHKTAPCGTLIDFTYNGRTLRVPVIDRGPYIVGREWDLTGATAAALDFPGLGQITWRCASC